jgi:hypothetical protein
VGAFALGAIVAGIAIAIFIMRGGDNGDNSAPAQRTGTPSSTGTPATGTPAATPGVLTGTFTKPADAVAAYVQQVLTETYVGPCPSSGQAASGICSRSLYETDQLATYFLERAGPPPVVGEAVLTVNPAGAWALDFIPAAAPAATIAVGANAVVYGAGDCLNFRAAASTSAQVTFCSPDGTRGPVVEGPAQADGKTWWRLEGLGWAVSDYLQPAP